MKKSGALAGVHVATVLFGFAGLFPRWLALPATAIVLGRTFFACLFLLLLLRLTGQSLRIGKGSHLLALVLSGMLLALHWVAFFRSIQLSSVAIGLLAYSSFPVFLVILEPLLFREEFRPSGLLLVAATLVGISLIAPAEHGLLRFSPGLLWGVLSGFTFALLVLVNRGLVRSYSGFQIAFWQDLIAFLALMPFFLKAPAPLTAGSILLLMVLGLICTAVAHSLFIRGMKLVKGQTAGLIAVAEPVYAILLAMVLLGEVPAPRTVAGGILILGTAVWVTVRPR